MSLASRRTCHSVKSALSLIVRGSRIRVWLVSTHAPWLNDFFASSGRCRCACRCDAVPLTRRFQRIWSWFRTVKIAPVNECCAGLHSRHKKNQQEQREPFHGVDANRSVTACQCSPLLHDGGRGLRDANVAEKFVFRQGLWIEDLRIPPGQECSNGSLILLAVVLWRTFSVGAIARRAINR